MTDADVRARPVRVTRRRAETRQRLLEAALDVVSEQSLQSVTIEAVCERAGYTRGAFYSNFTSMDAVLVALFEDRASAVLPALQENLSVAPAGTDLGEEEYLEGAIARLLSALPAERLWYLLLTDIAAQALRSAEAAAMLTRYRSSVAQQLSEALEAALQHLHRRPRTSLAELTAVLVAQYEGCTAQLYLDEHVLSEDARVGSLSALFLGLTEPLPAGTLDPVPAGTLDPVPTGTTDRGRGDVDARTPERVR